jgi:hypothetical protein
MTDKDATILCTLLNNPLGLFRLCSEQHGETIQSG